MSLFLFDQSVIEFLNCLLFKNLFTINISFYFFGKYTIEMNDNTFRNVLNFSIHKRRTECSIPRKKSCEFKMNYFINVCTSFTLFSNTMQGSTNIWSTSLHFSHLSFFVILEKYAIEIKDIIFIHVCNV